MNTRKFTAVLFSSILLNITLTGAYFYMKPEKLNGITTEVPMIIENEAGSVNYLLPKGTTLYFNKSMPEGYLQYIVYFNYKGKPLDGIGTDGINPAWIYDIEKNDAEKLINSHPLSKKDLEAILKSNSFSKQELIEIINSI